MDHGREPCPYRILGDIGGAFGMGAVGGGIWHAVKGSKNSPSGARMRGGLEVRMMHDLAGVHCAMHAPLQPCTPKKHAPSHVCCWTVHDGVIL